MQQLAHRYQQLDLPPPGGSGGSGNADLSKFTAGCHPARRLARVRRELPIGPGCDRDERPLVATARRAVRSCQGRPARARGNLERMKSSWGMGQAWVVAVALGLALVVVGRGDAAAADNATVGHGASVNAIVGDQSWIALHGAAPVGADELARIRTHLTWVGARLAAAPPAGLSPTARANRRARLADLVRYAAAGVFPHLEATATQRRPRFRDPAGRWCAVGFLMATSGAELAAREIVATHEYAYLADLRDPRVDAWATAQGFTRHELAMIQPTYEPLCDGWGRERGSDSPCARRRLAGQRLAIGVSIGGGIAQPEGRSMTYFLWGLDLRYAVTSFLAVGLTDIGVRVGADADGNHAALVATPIVELLRWPVRQPGDYLPELAYHVDVGLTVQHVYSGRAPPRRNPLGLRAMVGMRFNASDWPYFDVSVGAAVALTDGFVSDDYAPAGAVLPQLQLTVGFRP